MENKKIPVPPKRPVPQKPVIQNTAVVRPVPPPRPAIQKAEEVKEEIKPIEKQPEVKQAVQENKPEKPAIQPEQKEIKPAVVKEEKTKQPKAGLNDQSRGILFGLLGGFFLVAGIALFVLMFI